jgi:regulator of protease activity HflC (stomatin/prohibitin superfamily)
MVEFLIVLLVLVVIYVSQGIKIVSQSETIIIERLGKYNRTLQAGINIILPIVEKPKATAVRMPNGFIGLTKKLI